MDSVREQQAAHARDVWLDDFAQKAQMMRAASAMGLGLNPSEFARPFPGTQLSSSVEVKRTSGIGKVLGGALLGLTGAGVLGTGLLAAGAAGYALYAATQGSESSAGSLADSEARARVRIFWGDDEITPGQGATAETQEE